MTRGYPLERTDVLRLRPLLSLGRVELDLLVPARVPHVERVRGTDCLVCRRLAAHLGLPVRVARTGIRAVVLDEDGLPPVRGPLSVPQAGEAASVNGGGHAEPGQRLERGGQ